MGDIDALETAVSLVKAELVNRFDLDEQKLFLTSPSFFARIGGGVKAKTINDEYWYVFISFHEFLSQLTPSGTGILMWT